MKCIIKTVNNYDRTILKFIDSTTGEATSPSFTIISDPALEPFFITSSQTGGFTLYERVTKGENNTKYITFITLD